MVVSISPEMEAFDGLVMLVEGCSDFMAVLGIYFTLLEIEVVECAVIENKILEALAEGGGSGSEGVVAKIEE
jgi:hypothetical protein